MEKTEVTIYRWTSFSRTPGNLRPFSYRYDADPPDGIALRGQSSVATTRSLIRQHGGKPGPVVDGSLPPSDLNGRTR
jgi:hypothetical protein